MGRRRWIHNDLPPRVKARRSGSGLIYYYVINGREIPLGADYSHAAERAAVVLSTPPPDALGMPDEAEIVAKAVPANAMCGIYFLILNGAIAYVGQSLDVWRRIGQHMKSRRFDAFSWIACTPHELDRLETHFIQKFQPAQNVAIGPTFRTVAKSTVASH